MLTPEQCESVNSLVALFAIPFFTFGFTVHIDPLRANYRAIAADVVSKVVIGTWWVLFARGHRNAAVNWSITGFSLSTLTSSLVVGMPMAQAIYRDWAHQLMVQLSVFQAIVWITLLLFALEARKAALGTTEMCGRQAGRRRL
jgi:auxin efflux carrier family